MYMYMYVPSLLRSWLLVFGICWNYCISINLLNLFIYVYVYPPPPTPKKIIMVMIDCVCVMFRTKREIDDQWYMYLGELQLLNQARFH